MNIQKISMQSYPNFGGNPNSPKLKFAANDFYVQIRGYGKNKEWADTVIKTADLSSNLIQRGTSPENVLKVVTCGVKKANMKEKSLSKAENTGILRINRDNWFSQVADAFTCFTIDRYKSYADRLIKIRKTPLTPPEPKLAMTRPNIDYPELEHGDPLYINNSLDYVFKLCQKLFSQYVGKDFMPKELNDINNNIAEIRWILAHATPWIRGSDAISNVFMRAIYKSMGIKTYPLAKGVSLDMEAYCTELTQYKKNFPNYFEKPPIIVD